MKASFIWVELHSVKYTERASVTGTRKCVTVNLSGIQLFTETGNILEIWMEKVVKKEQNEFLSYCNHGQK